MDSSARRERLAVAVRRAVRSLWNAGPVLVTVVLLVGLLRTYVSPALLRSLFGGRPLFDALVGTAVGSVSTGNAITSYVVGGELLDQGVSLLAVTAFVVAWVTVGVVQYPAEASILGRRFALVRNVSGALLALVVSVVTVFVVGVLA
jgi:uncharacterized membrane protein YraQ (UPF0718 family)